MPAPFDHFRKAARQLRRNPGFSMTAILTLVVGIGATTAIFSIFYAVLMRPLPFPEPDRLVDLQTLQTMPGQAGTNTNDLSYPNFRDWRDQAHCFESMAGYHLNSIILNAVGANAARNLQIGVVTSDFFHVLGVAPALGRSFLRSEEKAGSQVVVISDALWVSAFHSSPDVIGTTVKLSDAFYTVVGVLPPGADFPFVAATPTDLWTTPAMDAVGKNPSTEERGWTQLSVVARLRRGVTLAQARAEMDTIQAALSARFPEDNANEKAVQVQPALEALVGNVRPALHILLLSVVALLLIACANVAGLMLARGSARQAELAVRAALGASRSELTMQLLAESVLLSLIGGGGGIVIALLTLKGLLRFIPKNLPRLDNIAINGPVLAFAIAVSLLTGILFGLLPARRLSQLNPALALQNASRTSTAGRKQHHLHAVLVVSETALGLILLIGAGLLIRSFLHMLSTDPGFNPRHTITFRVGTTDKSFPAEKRAQFYSELIHRLDALPGVQSATGAFPMPFSGGNMVNTFEIQEHPAALTNEPDARVSVVEEDYFKTLQIPLRSGRTFTAQDNRPDALPVVAINDTLAQKYFKGEDPLGKLIATGFDSEDTSKRLHWRRVVGVVGTVKRLGITEVPYSEYYLPYAQAPFTSPFMAMRVAGDPLTYEHAVSATVAALNKEAPVYRFRTVEEGMATATAQPRFQTLLLTAFAAIALLLVAVGLYAVLSYMVTQRTHEMGLRMALGAKRADVLELILRRGLFLAAAGLMIGTAASLVLTRFLASFLYGVHALDPLTFVSVACVLLLVSTAASLVPAIRAANLDPVKTLRNQ